ncbi:hypothetical protein EI171_20975 [Bradyrhizobium sp. LCT2]|uniref:hypothetical protein n=1 Tax=Bradyrhizobium sp. LCT2 TaxID=2493093 RepID=UPI00137453C7|nr:hypothetical protein [Bradyrhizobium sp. LCT2]QHP69542.1 hypothetical protein EI171_20975 [Bradyrhizobium sp. LCT2]
MEIERYFEQIVDPSIADFEANPTSVRHAFLAAVAVFHAIDYLDADRLRKKFRENNADFALVDRIAHAFKHVHTGHPADRNNQPLSAEGVIARPPAYYGVSGAWDLSRWNDPIGGVTLDGDRQLDILSAIKGAAEFLRLQIETDRSAGS